MTFDEILSHRSSIRRYTDQMPDAEAIRKILEAALLAPIVHLHKFHLSVVISKEVMNLAEEAAAKIFDAPDAPVRMPRPYMYGAPVWIILSGTKHDESTPQGRLMNNNLFWNVGSIIENMELKATELGLASCGINTTIVGMMDRPDVRKAAGIPDEYAALASVIVGYPVGKLPERNVKPEFIPVSYIR